MNHDFDKNLKLSFHGIQKQIVAIHKKDARICLTLHKGKKRPDPRSQFINLRWENNAAQRNSSKWIIHNWSKKGPKQILEEHAVNNPRSATQSQCSYVTQVWANQKQQLIDLLDTHDVDVMSDFDEGAWEAWQQMVETERMLAIAGRSDSVHLINRITCSRRHLQLLVSSRLCERSHQICRAASRRPSSTQWCGPPKWHTANVP